MALLPLPSWQNHVRTPYQGRAGPLVDRPAAAAVAGSGVPIEATARVLEGLDQYHGESTSGGLLNKVWSLVQGVGAPISQALSSLHLGSSDGQNIQKRALLSKRRKYTKYKILFVPPAPTVHHLRRHRHIVPNSQDYHSPPSPPRWQQQKHLADLRRLQRLKELQQRHRQRQRQQQRIFKHQELFSNQLLPDDHFGQLDLSEIQNEDTEEYEKLLAELRERDYQDLINELDDSPGTEMPASESSGEAVEGENLPDDDDDMDTASSNDEVHLHQILDLCNDSTKDCQNETSITLSPAPPVSGESDALSFEVDGRSGEKEQQQQQQQDMVIKFVPVFPDKELPYYKSVTVPKDSLEDGEEYIYHFNDEQEDDPADSEDDQDDYDYDEILDNHVEPSEELPVALALVQSPQPTASSDNSLFDDYAEYEVDVENEKEEDLDAYLVPTVPQQPATDVPAVLPPVKQRPRPPVRHALSSVGQYPYPVQPVLPAVSVQQQQRLQRLRRLRQQQRRRKQRLKDPMISSPSSRHPSTLAHPRYKRPGLVKNGPGSLRRFHTRPRHLTLLERGNSRQGFAAASAATALTPALLGMLPLVLFGGLALGYFAFADNGQTANVTTIVNINGTHVTNTFTPMNTATATNNDQDNIMVDTTGRTFGDLSWGQYFKVLVSKTVSLVGSSESSFGKDMIRSGLSIRPNDVQRQLALLAQRLSCMVKPESDKEEKPPDGCLRRLICEHFSEDHAVYGGNLVLRSSELFVVGLLRWFQFSEPLSEAESIMNVAVQDECGLHYTCPNTALLERCQDIL